jgi:hypothetical protein
MYVSTFAYVCRYFDDSVVTDVAFEHFAMIRISSEYQLINYLLRLF